MNSIAAGIARIVLSCALLADQGTALANSTKSASRQSAQPVAPAGTGLFARARNCELDAVGETIDHIRYSTPTSSSSHIETIRHAVGSCTRFVLAVALPDEVGRFCAAPDSLTAVQTARELRRRMAAIESDTLLRSSAAGQACKASYARELKSRRVVLRSSS